MHPDANVGSGQFTVIGAPWGNKCQKDQKRQGLVVLVGWVCQFNCGQAWKCGRDAAKSV